MSLLNKINFITIIGAISIFPLGVLIRFNPFRNFNIYPADILVACIFFLIVIQILRNKKLEQYKGIIISILILNVVAIFSLLMSEINLNINELFVSASYLVRFDMYISLLLVGILELSKKQTLLLKKLFIVSSAVFVLFGFVQYVFYNNLKNLYYLGWDDHLYRLFSTFLDPNFAGLFLALLSLLFIGFVIKGTKNILLRNIYIMAASITILALVLTFSRTAIISLLVGISYLLIASKKKIALLFFVFVFFLGLFWVSDFSIEGMNPVRIASSEARVRSMQEAFEIFTDSPIYGIGFNAYRYAQIEKGFRGEPVIQSNADAGTDNSFLFILATTGAIGLAVYFSIWASIYKKISLIKNGIDRRIIISVVLAYFAGSFFINALFYAPLMLWAFLYIGITIRDSNLRT